MKIKRIKGKVLYKIDQYFKENALLSDINSHIGNKNNPLIFDIGGNKGQTIERYKKVFPKSTIHCFEPQQSNFEQLTSKYSNSQDIILNNTGVGSVNTEMEFKENKYSDMSSFLDLSIDGWGNIVTTTKTKVITVDEYCSRKNIAQIDLLKSDTQGFELEVFKGAQNMMKNNKIQLLLFEFILSDMYKGLPSFGDIFNHLTANNFRLINFHDLQVRNGFLSYGDALFANEIYPEMLHSQSR
jgi:FkbM family methyltransferase